MGRSKCGELGNQELNVFSKQGLTACEANFLNTVGDELSRDAGDFLKRQQRCVRKVGVVFVKDFFGHAVTAAKITPIGHADTQIAQRAMQAICHRTVGNHCSCGIKGGSGRGQGERALVVKADGPGGGAFRHGPIVYCSPCILSLTGIKSLFSRVFMGFLRFHHSNPDGNRALP